MRAARAMAAMAVLLSGATSALAQAPAANADQACALPAVADQVELKALAGTDLLTVPVAINGVAKQFLLDIGANLTEVSPATVSALNLPDARNSHSDALALAPGVDHYKEMTSHANFDMNQTLTATMFNVKGASSGENYRPHVLIASFTMGEATGHNLAFVIAKDEEMGKSPAKPYDGLLTGDFFKQYDVELDPAGKKLTYLTSTSCADPQKIAYWPHKDVAVIPMTNQDDGKMHVQVVIQGHVINAVIDTSFDRSVMRRGVAEQTMGFSHDTPDMMPDGARRDGRGQQIYIHTFPQISFAGGVVAVNVPTDIQNYSMVHDMHRQPELGSRARYSETPDIADLTLGMDVIQQLHLLISPARKNIYVTQE